MFVRFSRAGLSWPLPAGISEQELDARLYGQFSTVPVVRPESTVISGSPVVKRPRRPNFPLSLKIALVSSHCSPEPVWRRSPGKTESTITCSSTGAINTGKVACCLPEKYAGTASPRDVNAGAG